MNKSWYRAYFAAIQGITAHNGGRGVDGAPTNVVLDAAAFADASEAYLTKRGEDEDAVDEAKRQAWEKEATEKVLRIGRYVWGSDKGEYLIVKEVIGGRVLFESGIFADLVDVAAEEGFVPAPIDEPRGSGSGGGVGVILVHNDGASVQLNAGGSSSAGDAVQSPHIPHAFVAGNGGAGGAGGTASPNPMAGGSSNGQGPHGFKREPQQ